MVVCIFDASGRCIQRIGDCVDLLGAPSGQVGTLMEVLPYKAIRVFVRTALPWAAGIGEEDFHPGLNREPGMVA